MDTLDESGFAVLTIYMKPDLAEVSRVLQALVLQPIMVERFSANLAPADVRKVNGLETRSKPVMRLVVVGSTDAERDLERVTKALNRLVAVYKVQAVQA